MKDDFLYFIDLTWKFQNVDVFFEIAFFKALRRVFHSSLPHLYDLHVVLKE